MDVLAVKNLCKKYESFELRNVSFGLREGTVTGFIGRNGAGKTTTLKSLLNFVHPDGGEIRFFGTGICRARACSQAKDRLCFGWNRLLPDEEAQGYH